MTDLGELVDPTLFHGPIDIKGLDVAALTASLDMMIRIRTVEEFLADRIDSGEIVCPCHLAIGQEAIAVGVSNALRPSDRVFGNHRSHGHFLAVGGSVRELLAETLGRATGCSGGMGGSMHLQDRSVGFIGSVPIVGATVPMAVGAGLAASLGDSGDVAVSYFGDGAMEEGAVHEAMNFAARFNVPVIFVAENNLFSSHLHILERQPSDSLARYGRAHRIATVTVDGNDVAQVESAARRLVERARAGEGPGFLEAVTFRWRGHVGASEDSDVGVARAEGLLDWKRRDCIARLATAMHHRGDIAADHVHRTTAAVVKECARAWDEAVAAPHPSPEDLLGLVYRGAGRDD